MIHFIGTCHQLARVELRDIKVAYQGHMYTVQKASSHVKLHRMSVYLLLLDTTLP